uniref:Uncharacterized protein n=1 Tax=Rhizophora mucronata TaxID=61149 RepID=A0A2P2PMM7_RHIMU
MLVNQLSLPQNSGCTTHNMIMAVINNNLANETMVVSIHWILSKVHLRIHKARPQPLSG